MGEPVPGDQPIIPDQDKMNSEHNVIFVHNSQRDLSTHNSGIGKSIVKAVDNKNLIIDIAKEITKSSVETESDTNSSLDSEVSDGNTISKWQKYGGLILAVNSSLVFSLTALIVKYLKGYHPITIALWRYQGVLFPCIPLLLYHQFVSRKKNHVYEKEVEIRTKSAWDTITPLTEWKKLKMCILLLTRSILTCNALLLHFYSLSYLPIGDALVISSSTPVFVCICSHYFLGEKSGFVPIILAILTVFGVVVITRPPHFTGESFDVNTLIGVGLSLGCMILATVSFVILRYIRKIHYCATITFFGAWGTFETVILGLIFGYLTLPQGAHDWICAALLAFLNFVGQLSIIVALKSEEASPVSLVRTCDVIFAFAWQILFLQNHPDIFSIIGALMVLLGVAITAIRKWLACLAKEDPYRKRLWFILK